MIQKFNVELLKEIPIYEVCEMLGARYARGHKSYSKTFAMHCFCGMHEHGDKNPSLIVWKDKNICKCMVNPEIKGDTITLVKNVLFNGDFKQACIWLHENFSIPYITEYKNENEKKIYYIQKFSSLAFKAKRKKIQEAERKKIQKNIKESTLPKILISKPTVAKNFKHLDMYNKQLAKYMKENRGLTEFNNLPVTKLVLIDRQTEKVKGYNSAVVVPFGIYDYSIFEKSEEELKDLIYRNGAELRLSEKIEDLKSYTKIGYDENGERKRKTSTMFINEDSTNLAVFESVFDYIAMQPVINHETTDILIMNGASMVLSLAEMLKESNFKKEYQFALFFQQNDIASYKMVENLLTNEEISDYLQFGEHFITLYKKNEEKKDINDLVKDGIAPEDIVKRLTKIKPEALREKIDSEKKNIENENIPKPKPKGI